MENPYEPPGSRMEPVEPVDLGPGAARPRNTALLVLGILNIILGSLGLLCCSPYKIIGGMAAAPDRVKEIQVNNLEKGAGEAGAEAEVEAVETQDQFMRKLLELASSPTMRMFNLTDGVLGFAANAMLIVGGIGLILHKKWGWTLSILCGLLAILSSVAGLLVQTTGIILPLMEYAKGQADPAVQAGVIGAVIGAYGQGLVLLIYPIVLLAILTRPRIRAVLQA